MTAFLGQICRRQVDGNPPGWQRQADGRQGRTYTLLAFSHGLVAKADDGKCDDARGHVDLNVHRHGFHALEGHSGHARHHAPASRNDFGSPYRKEEQRQEH